ncbi:DUF1330 domain-containing protein [Sulfitobacter mediterraneus]|uniref:DUF1330 domain-containing protein n=1 Tax=Sulfitobacter mediterraneus TaxID=83219 RepID=UPI001932DBA9|nr:DUF1330 domain-containing protein [Sulfitobacter mediterraneus]MBM1634345.1 DUF1330 domain-containing protein [Sulfitobacter mediterraneus]MBM1642162.1 DUF1330 domain-containing protein [Sulfitobacter mediterraneus]MBM1646211.1 DUF1330 domain-containing protein [Sulfitobacter mediterraneus]MBM1650257.1 DUF1330 domain-containing protein [Sulfitobacter mediterraneus]MBM1654279.1 DUF1330 domain-containing protein [Sulfitobacter mediterraneus]
MPAYVIFQEDIQDQEKFAEYKTLSPASISQFGGKFIVRGGDITELEGQFEYERIVVISFPDKAAALAWYNSTEYEPAKNMRLSCSSGVSVLVEGA